MQWLIEVEYLYKMVKQFFVSGCQRSGTRFYSKYLAKKNNIEYIDEDTFGVYDYKRLKELLKDKKDFSVHCPSLKQHISDIKKDFPKCKVIWMRRNPAECEMSMKKINWEKHADREINAIQSLMPTFNEALYENKFQAVIFGSVFLALYYEDVNLVDEIIRMENISHLEGFKQGTKLEN